MRPLADEQVFTGATLNELGRTPDAKRHAVSTGLLIRLRRGVYTTTLEPGARQHAIAAALAIASSCISHRSAALVRELPLLDPVPRRPELTVPPGDPVSSPGLHVHRARLRAGDVTMVAGARCTTAARTFVDVARRASLTEAVALGDAVLHGRTPRAEIDRVLIDCWNWPGIRRAHRASALLDAASESPPESISRLVLRDHRLPIADLQRVIRNDWGGNIARVDFYWDEFGVVGQADGVEKYGDAAARPDSRSMGLARRPVRTTRTHPPPRGRVRPRHVARPIGFYPRMGTGAVRQPRFEVKT